MIGCGAYWIKHINIWPFRRMKWITCKNFAHRQIHLFEVVPTEPFRQCTSEVAFASASIGGPSADCFPHNVARRGIFCSKPWSSGDVWEHYLIMTRDCFIFMTITKSCHWLSATIKTSLASFDIIIDEIGWIDWSVWYDTRTCAIFPNLQSTRDSAGWWAAPASMSPQQQRERGSKNNQPVLVRMLGSDAIYNEELGWFQHLL